MKKFPIKFKPLVIVFFVIIVLALAAVVVFNVKRIVDTGFDARYLWLYIIFIILSLAQLALLISMAFFSQYKIADKYLYICLGFLPIKIVIKKIDKIVKYEKNKETFIFYTRNDIKKTHLLFIDYSKQREFLDSLKSINQNIIIIENETQIEN